MSSYVDVALTCYVRVLSKAAHAIVVKPQKRSGGDDSRSDPVYGKAPRGRGGKGGRAPGPVPTNPHKRLLYNFSRLKIEYQDVPVVDLLRDISMAVTLKKVVRADPRVVSQFAREWLFYKDVLYRANMEHIQSTVEIDPSRYQTAVSNVTFDTLLSNEYWQRVRRRAGNPKEQELTRSMSMLIPPEYQRYPLGLHPTDLDHGEDDDDDGGSKDESSVVVIKMEEETKDPLPESLLPVSGGGGEDGNDATRAIVDSGIRGLRTWVDCLLQDVIYRATYGNNVALAHSVPVRNLVAGAAATTGILTKRVPMDPAAQKSAAADLWLTARGRTAAATAIVSDGSAAVRASLNQMYTEAAVRFKAALGSPAGNGKPPNVYLKELLAEAIRFRHTRILAIEATPAFADAIAVCGAVGVINSIIELLEELHTDYLKLQASVEPAVNLVRDIARASTAIVATLGTELASVEESIRLVTRVRDLFMDSLRELYALLFERAGLQDTLAYFSVLHDAVTREDAKLTGLSTLEATNWFRVTSEQMGPVHISTDKLIEDVGIGINSQWIRCMALASESADDREQKRASPLPYSVPPPPPEFVRDNGMETAGVKALLNLNRLGKRMAAAAATIGEQLRQADTVVNRIQMSRDGAHLAFDAARIQGWGGLVVGSDEVRELDALRHIATYGAGLAPLPDKDVLLDTVWSKLDTLSGPCRMRDLMDASEPLMIACITQDLRRSP